MNLLKDFVNSFTDLIGNTITGLLLTVAVAVFFYSIVRFLMQRAKGDAEGMKDAANRLGWSIVALFVMFSIWGIITFLQSNFGFNRTTINPPSISMNPTPCVEVGGANGTEECGSDVIGEDRCDLPTQSACEGVGGCYWYPNGDADIGGNSTPYCASFSL